MTAMTADYQRGYRAGLKAAKADTTRDKDARAFLSSMNPGYPAEKRVEIAFQYADLMEVERNKKSL